MPPALSGLGTINKRRGFTEQKTAQIVDWPALYGRTSGGQSQCRKSEERDGEKGWRRPAASSPSLFLGRQGGVTTAHRSSSSPSLCLFPPYTTIMTMTMTMTTSTASAQPAILTTAAKCHSPSPSPRSFSEVPRLLSFRAMTTTTSNSALTRPNDRHSPSKVQSGRDAVVSPFLFSGSDRRRRCAPYCCFEGAATATTLAVGGSKRCRP